MSTTAIELNPAVLIQIVNLRVPCLTIQALATLLPSQLLLLRLIIVLQLGMIGFDWAN